MGRADRTDHPDPRHVVGPFDAAGRPFVVSVDDGAAASAIEELLRDLRVGADAESTANPVVFDVTRVPGEEASAGPPIGGDPVVPSGDWSVTRDGVPCETVASWYLLTYLVWELTRLASEHHLARDGAAVVHAAVVALDGSAVLLVGASHAGKSTTAAWLVARHGWSHLSDELAFVDVDRRRVRAFHRPVGVRRGGPLDAVIEVPGAADEAMVPVSSFGQVADEADVAAIVFLTRAEGGSPHPAPVARSEALVRLVQQSPGVDDAHGRLFGELVRLAAGVPAYSFAISDLDAGARALADVLATSGERRDGSDDRDRRTPAPTVHGAAVDAAGESSRGGASRDGRVAIAPGVFWVELGDEVVVFRPGNPTEQGEVHRLNSSSATVWHVLVEGVADLDRVVAGVAARVGLSADALEGDVRTVIGVLVERCLVVEGR